MPEIKKKRTPTHGYSASSVTHAVKSSLYKESISNPTRFWKALPVFDASAHW